MPGPLKIEIGDAADVHPTPAPSGAQRLLAAQALAAKAYAAGQPPSPIVQQALAGFQQEPTDEQVAAMAWKLSKEQGPMVAAEFTAYADGLRQTKHDAAAQTNYAQRMVAKEVPYAGEPAPVSAEYPQPDARSGENVRTPAYIQAQLPPESSPPPRQGTTVSVQPGSTQAGFVTDGTKSGVGDWINYLGRGLASTFTLGAMKPPPEAVKGADRLVGTVGENISNTVKKAKSDTEEELRKKAKEKATVASK